MLCPSDFIFQTCSWHVSQSYIIPLPLQFTNLQSTIHLLLHLPISADLILNDLRVHDVIDRAATEFQQLPQRANEMHMLCAFWRQRFEYISTAET